MHDNWQSLEEFDAFKKLEDLSDEIWFVVTEWKPLAQETVGKQLIRAADSIGANLVEGDGRYHWKEKLNFCYIARGSMRETSFWVRRAQRRGLMAEEQAQDIRRRLEAGRRWINTLIAERRRWSSEVREESAEYTA